MPIVDLSCDAAGLALLIPFPSGVEYTTQTGGTSCLHPALEGIYIPLANETEEGAFSGPRNRELRSPEHELVEYFCGPPYNGSGATSGLTEADAVFIESILEKFDLDECLRVDRDRLADSHESWVYVTIIDEGEYTAFRDWGPYPRSAVLTWLNSD